MRASLIAAWALLIDEQAWYIEPHGKREKAQFNYIALSLGLQFLMLTIWQNLGEVGGMFHFIL